jgi:DNA polymerase III sliding clamp (beta) subunit (PCNA family)
MNVTCAQPHLASALELAATIARGAPINSPPTQLLLTARGKRLAVAADVGGLRLETSISADVRAPGSLIAPVQLSNFITDLLPSQVSFDSIGPLTLEVKSLRWRSTLVCADAKSFPQSVPFTSGPRFSISEHDLLRGLRQVAIAINETTNAALYASLLECREGVMTLVGLDSRRVAVRRLPLTTTGGDIHVVVPKRALDVIDTLLKHFPLENADVVQSSSGNALRVSIGTATLTCLLQATNFAAYERLLDAKFRTTVTVGRSGLAQAIRTASNFTVDAAHGVRLTFNSDGVLTASAAAPDIGATDGQVEIEIEGPSARTTLGTKVAMDALSVIDTDFVRLQLAGPLDPVAFSPVGTEDYVYVMNATSDAGWKPGTVTKGPV